MQILDSTSNTSYTLYYIFFRYFFLSEKKSIWKMQGAGIKKNGFWM